MSYALDELPWTEVARVLAERPRLILPVGALEQHGPHLPVGTNVVIARRVARAVSERLGILCAPSFSYGVTFTGDPFRGPAGLRRKTFHRAINELVARWEDDGVQHFSMITAHRFEPHVEALLMTQSGPSTTSVYDLYQIDVSDIVDNDPDFEHAGELETSLVLHLSPDSVRMDQVRDYLPEGVRLRKYTRRRVPKAPAASGGVIGAPSRATAEKGEAIFNRYVEALCIAIPREGQREGTDPGS